MSGPERDGSRQVAYCGLDCSACPASLATRNGDEELLARTAERWSSHEHRVTPDDVRCDGCRGKGERLAAFCSMCPVRACARNRGLPDCSACDDYPCSTLEGLWKTTGARDEAKPVLDEQRRTRDS